LLYQVFEFLSSEDKRGDFVLETFQRSLMPPFFLSTFVQKSECGGVIQPEASL
jgi:hypothetical protein